MKYFIQGISLAIYLISQNIHAGVVITGTRIIYPSNQSSVTVQLSNPGEHPSLIQSWLDDGNPSSIPEAGKIPFILTPPVTQVLPKKGQMIRLIAHKAEQLPQDRETMYWFNILDIPAVEESDKAQNKLNISIRSRIKFFYRPVKLSTTQEKAFKSANVNYDLSKKKIVINNNSAYYLNFQYLRLNADQKKSEYPESILIQPFETQELSPKIEFTPKKIEYGLINDYGAVQNFEKNIE
ncbi:fimbrial biogenesis chaperone [Acinetobacter lanii]|uniref:Molecular chaperone n=1 Tax=Acinetobacter lanii TaxID=2715163 RepID=A0A6G8S7S8_9GAMM|nr:molecular chaperone [Acinetobacter lanii]QIO10239.1 molecular chaperone [Acinetobacter lanii]